MIVESKPPPPDPEEILALADKEMARGDLAADVGSGPRLLAFGAWTAIRFADELAASVDPAGVSPAVVHNPPANVIASAYPREGISLLNTEVSTSVTLVGRYRAQLERWKTEWASAGTEWNVRRLAAAVSGGLAGASWPAVKAVRLEEREFAYQPGVSGLAAMSTSFRVGGGGYLSKNDRNRMIRDVLDPLHRRCVLGRPRERMSVVRWGGWGTDEPPGPPFRTASKTAGRRNLYLGKRRLWKCWRS